MCFRTRPPRNSLKAKHHVVFDGAFLFVLHGDQSFELDLGRMMVGFFNLAFDVNMPVQDIFTAQSVAKPTTSK